MTEPEWTVLVPVQILEGETVPDAVIDALTGLPVVVLGYHVLPEQTPPGQARMQFEEPAQTKLDDLAAAFGERGASCETRLVFTHDEEQTLDRVAEETGADAVLIPNPAARIERLLVPIGGEVDADRITAFVAALIGGRNVDVTLFHAAETEAARDAGQSRLDDVRGLLTDRGVDADAVRTEVTTSEHPIRAISTAAADHDAVIMGESEPSLRAFLFGEAPEQVAAQSLGPVVVVRRPRDSDADDEG